MSADPDHFLWNRHVTAVAEAEKAYLDYMEACVERGEDARPSLIVRAAWGVCYRCDIRVDGLTPEQADDEESIRCEQCADPSPAASTSDRGRSDD